METQERGRRGRCENFTRSPGDCTAMNNKMRFEFVPSMGFCASNEFILLEFIKGTREYATIVAFVAEIERFFVISR